MAGVKSAALQQFCSKATFGVPKGCIVRNTFLQWQFYEIQTKEEGTSDNEHQVIYLDHAEPSVKRSHSCPVFPGSAGSLVQQSLPEATARNCHDAKEPFKTEMSWADQMADLTGSTTSGGEDDTLEVSQDFPELSDSTPSNNKPKTQSRWDLDDDWRSPVSRDTQRRLRARESKSGRSKAQVSSNTLVLRGLPFNVTEAEVYDFIEEVGAKRYLAHIDNPVNLLTNAQGKPSGFAEVHVGRTSDMAEVRGKIHNKYFGNRYIEVLPYRSEKHERFSDRRGSWRR